MTGAKNGLVRPLDALTLLRNHLQLFPNFLPFPWSSLAVRYAAVRTWRQGRLPFIHLPQAFLPRRFRSQETQSALDGYLHDAISEVFEEQNLYQADAVALFWRPFRACDSGSFENWLSAMEHISRIILDDQYKARRFLRKDSVILDAGAHIGVFSVFAASLAPAGKVYCFEPSSRPYQALRQNTKGYQNIRVFPVALGDRTGKGQLLNHSTFDDSDTMGDSAIAGGDLEAWTGREEVDLLTVDEFVASEGISRVDLLKIDTEGYERQILEGARETIQAHAPVLAIAAYHSPADKREIRDLVLSLNWRYRSRLERHPEKDFFFWVK